MDVEAARAGLAVDDELAKTVDARSADLAKLIVAVEALTRFLAEAKPEGACGMYRPPIGPVSAIERAIVCM